MLDRMSSSLRGRSRPTNGGNAGVSTIPNTSIMSGNSCRCFLSMGLPPSYLYTKMYGRGILAAQEPRRGRSKLSVLILTRCRKQRRRGWSE